ncbi:hypothetical protein [Corynebacterium amycolatum]|uniref:hypothetical protein n=1 Tax=Corynebacterium amycolatum TaxID=43765 RepID=UPI00254B2E2D|nr:hypothetical protein [Corynebacterium amycolatum]
MSPTALCPRGASTPPGPKAVSPWALLVVAKSAKKSVVTSGGEKGLCNAWS